MGMERTTQIMKVTSMIIQEKDKKVGGAGRGKMQLIVLLGTELGQCISIFHWYRSDRKFEFGGQE
jgi:hypothetical protein